MSTNVLIFCLTVGIIFSANITKAIAGINCVPSYSLGDSKTSWSATLTDKEKEFVVVCDELKMEKLTQALSTRIGTWTLLSQDPNNSASLFRETIYDPLSVGLPVECPQGYSLTLRYNIVIPIATSTGRTVEGVPHQIQGEDIAPYLTSSSNIVFTSDIESIKAFVNIFENCWDLNTSITYPGRSLPISIQHPIVENVINFLDANNTPTGIATVTLALPLRVQIALENEDNFYEGFGFLVLKKIELYVTSDERKHIVDFLKNKNSFYGVLSEQNVFAYKSFYVDIKVSCEQTNDTAAFPTNAEGKEVLTLVINDICMITAE